MALHIDTGRKCDRCNIDDVNDRYTRHLALLDIGDLLRDYRLYSSRIARVAGKGWRSNKPEHRNQNQRLHGKFLCVNYAFRFTILLGNW